MGAAVFVSIGSLHVRNSIVRDFLADSQGGAIRAFRSDASIENTILRGNRLTPAGGGANQGGTLHAYDSTIVIRDSTVTDARTRVGWGSVYVEGGTFLAETTDFTDLHTEAGGAIYLTGGTAATVDDCLFARNEADHAGGAILAEDSDLSVWDSTFEENVSHTAPSTWVPTIRRPILPALAGGGAILAFSNSTPSNLNVTRSTFTRNETAVTAMSHGGAVHGFNVSGGFVDTDFTENRTDFGGSGGAIHWEAAPSGSPISLGVRDSTFTLNEVPTSPLIWGDGGGIAARGADLEILASVFDRNQGANAGGAIAMADGSSKVEDTYLVDNHAGVRGGGIDVRGSGFHEVLGSTLHRNSADALGAALHMSGGGGSSLARVTLTNSTLSGNTTPLADSGIHLDSYARAQLLNATLWGSSPSTPLIVAGTGPGNAVLMQMSLTQNGRCSFGGVATAGWTNLAQSSSCRLPGDLLFTNPVVSPLADNGGPTLTHALPPTVTRLPFGITVPNPAVDAACGAPAGVDQRGYARPADGDGDGTACNDLGAYERNATP